MVVSFNINHIFKYPVNIVAKTYINNINNNNSNNVKDVQLTKDDSSGMDCISFISRWENCFPRFLQRLEMFQKNYIDFHQEIWSQWDEKRHWIRSRNVTWQDDSEIARLVYISQHENNQNWTFWEETHVINFDSFGTIGYGLEMYMKRKLKTKSIQEIKSLEATMKSC
ncbi:hypothetical protein O3M35_001001 [Rhynocoris fuscipes]|uniref:PRELI/MSF1 domain-containing protein n=1 Tax=Rhynocoris fuscipes TaxID=488301 RepID=A0AAW1DRA7_9HEMI